MLRITPCQRMISDRFPVASFVVNVPSDRVFEIACATDPSLFRSDQKHRRSAENFYTSRSGGLLRAPAGQATYLLPPDQLRRFAGRTRLYYALGAYGMRGNGAQFSVPIEQVEQAPSIQIAGDFTGRSLDRRRLQKGPSDGRYGASTPQVLSWGGDLVAAAYGAPAQQARATEEYDDGYPKELWSARGLEESPEEGRGIEESPEEPASGSLPVPEPGGYEDAPAMRADLGPGTNPADRPDAADESDAAPAYGGPAPSARSQAPLARLPEDRGISPVDESRTAPASPRYGGVAPARVPVVRYARGATRSEPPGAEDAPALMRSRGHAPRYGARGLENAQVPATPAVPPPGVGNAVEGGPAGKDDAYDDTSDDGLAALPIQLTGVQALSDSALPVLTIRKKLDIIRPVIGLESGRDRYSAINPDGEFNDPTHPAYQRTHIGLSWGIVQFTQRSGMLGRALEACKRRDAARFAEVFGPASEELLRVTNAGGPEERVQAVENAFLWQEPWLGRFRQAGQVEAFQAAQNQVAIEGYFDPNLVFAGWLGFDTDRALAMLFDRCVNMGNAGGHRFVIEAVSPLGSDADRQRALAGLGFATVLDFQRSISGLRADGVFGPVTHAALIGALRGQGAQAAVAVPTLPEMLDDLVRAANGRRFEHRMSALRESTELSDTRYQVP